MNINIEMGFALGEELERQLFKIKRRELRDRSNPFEIPDRVFRKHYRFPKHLAINLVEDLSPFLDEPVRRTCVPKHLKVLCALHFYAHGSYQKSIGQDFVSPLSQTMVSRCIRQILTENLSQRYIKFPRTQQEKLLVTQRFMEKYNFPGVIGCLDCTHIAIIAPSNENNIHPGFAYLNRKGFHSINCQIICDSNLMILNCNARYPGSMHDAAIWNMSGVFDHSQEGFNNNERGFWLLGDSGYPLQPWLLTPIEGALEGTPEGQYTRAHITCRNPIERCNGVLKMRFRCLLKHRVLHYDPVTAAHIIYSCCVLHNILTTHRIDEEDYDVIEPDDVVQVDNCRQAEVEENGDLSRIGRRIRAQLIRNHFTYSRSYKQKNNLSLLNFELKLNPKPNLLRSHKYNSAINVLWLVNVELNI